MNQPLPRHKPGLLSRTRTFLRWKIMYVRWLVMTRVWGMDIHRDTQISLEAKLDKTYPAGVHVGEGTAISFGAVILSHDYIRRMHTHTRIGRFCQIGARSIIMPGLTVGDHSIVAAGAVVVKDVPPNSIVAGNPAKIIRENIETVHWGRLKQYDDA
ncbi:acyltransferase [uncultured Methylobacterium sp.]|jgi:acetyltransferase-like isoleucine patch superfamily enzyme|uniref:acyltransferase n=1 Tax=uncultured Methylobacterium sp. TaxID=157278 RepID=UPI0026298185|nr:acyltransferase [uncultured Methylobacterium sp.]